jgi:colicin import membrane protein
MRDDGDARAGVRWFSHAEGAQELGIKAQSFRRLAARQRWEHMIANDGGDRIAVPVEVIERYKERRRAARAASARLRDEGTVTVAEAIADLLAGRRAAEARVRSLEAELSQQQERAGKAEATVVELRRMLALADGVLRGASDARSAAELAATEAREAAIEAGARAEHLARELEAATTQAAGLQDALSAQQEERDRLQSDLDGARATAREMEVALRTARETGERGDVARREAEARAVAEAARAEAESRRAAQAVQRAEEAERRATIAETRQQALRAEAERRAEEGRRQAAAEAATKAQTARPWWRKLLGR